MEEVLNDLPADYQEHIADLLEGQSMTSIKSYVRDLIAADIAARCPTQGGEPIA